MFPLILKELSAFYSFTAKKRDFGDFPGRNSEARGTRRLDRLPTGEKPSLTPASKDRLLGTPNVSGETGIFLPISIVRRRRVIFCNEWRRKWRGGLACTSTPLPFCSLFPVSSYPINKGISP
jgi:hypothetical protein